MTAPKQLFESLAQSTWERLRLSWDYNISQGEETITDLLQLEIARFGPPNVHVIKTTKAHEAQSGVDWEWWIGSDSSGWLRFAIQAKKISGDGRYHSLKHKVQLPGGRKRLQNTLLKRYAWINGAIPLYCLFNQVEPSSVNQQYHWHCSDNFDPMQLGCTLTPVLRIEEAIRQRGCRTFDFIHRRFETFPWRCLFCPKCDGLPFLLISSRFVRGFRPRLYPHLPPALTRARDSNLALGVGAEATEDGQPDQEVPEITAENNDRSLPILPRRILLIETNLSEISNEIRMLTDTE